MAKRFTDTNKYKKPFIRGLQGPYKLLWDYLYHDCDHAGIWIVDFEIAQIYLGKDMPINKEDALRFFNEGEDRIVEIDNGTRWFILPFIEIQYGELSEGNRAHNSVIQILEKHGLWNKGLIRGLQGRKDKDKDKEQDMEMDKEKDLIHQFEIFRQNYPGTKRGHEVEFENFRKKHKDWKEVIPILGDRLNYQISAREEKYFKGGFVPEWKNLQTWINQRCWEEEIETNNISNGNNRKNNGPTTEELTAIVAKHSSVQ